METELGEVLPGVFDDTELVCGHTGTWIGCSFKNPSGTPMRSLCPLTRVTGKMLLSPLYNEECQRKKTMFTKLVT